MMAHQSPASATPPRLDELIELNREIAALVRAGIPLELGLRGLVGSVPSRLGSLADRLADRLSSGLTLVEALEQEGPAVSPVYTAVVGAGLQSGQLPQALESLAASGEVVHDARQRVSLALVYPAAVAVLGYVLIAFFLWTVVPRYLSLAEEMQMANHPVFVVLRALHRTLPMWATLIPACVLAVVVIRVGLRGWRGTSLSWRWVPGIAGVYRSLSWAQFADLLSLQVAHGLPLSKSLRRAAAATNDSRLQSAVSATSDQLERGDSFSDAVSDTRALPPLMSWMMATAEKQGTLAPTLRLLAESYRRRALYRAQMFRIWLPVIITVTISGSIALAYGLFFFVPLRLMWNGLMQE